MKYLYITLASFVFYSFWDFRFLFLFVIIGLTDYSLALAIQRYSHWGKGLVAISIVNSLAWLILFKYSDFVAIHLDMILKLFDVNLRLRSRVPEVMLIGPVGLSFYSFMSISYLIETFRGRMVPTRNPLHYLAYLSFFPHLMCGPIIRARDLLVQLEEKRTSSEGQRWEAAILISHGYFKKVVLADNFAPFVNAAFVNPQFNESGIYWWVVMIFFAAQIYCDFSGYSDIARGLFKGMGYDIPLNFNHPYISLGLREFWQRWHISLSTWFRDYVYIPIGGSKTPAIKALRNLWITFLLSGIWHGAAWHFVAWGGLHALYLTLERWTRWPSRLGRLRFGNALCLGVTLLQVISAWVFFRAENLSQGMKILLAMFTRFSLDLTIPPFVSALLLLLILRETFIYFSSKDRFHFAFFDWKPIQELTLALLLTAAVYLRGPGYAFIYFQF